SRSPRRWQAGRPAMSKITTEHLARSAFVYDRQSTADQLVHNQESRHRQYGLADRARQLGWTSVEVIDDDLGRSGDGVISVGLALSVCCRQSAPAVSAPCLRSRHRVSHATAATGITLIEFCGLIGTIIVDEDGIYDPRHPNDRLLLGMKGTMSE